MKIEPIGTTAGHPFAAPATPAPAAPGHQPDPDFTAEAREALYHTIFSRRDVRGQFLPDPVPDEVLSRLLTAAHFAPSVGFMQPWSFIVVKDPATKAAVHSAFDEANREAAEMFEQHRQGLYRSLKLEGIQEAPINLCITCDRDRAGPVVIGRTHLKVMDIYSAVCAVQNLWLAARAEGLGVGWVSIFHQARLKEILDIPERVIPIAYLCIGRVSHFYAKPELESAGWRSRLPLETLVHAERFGAPVPEALVPHLQADQARAARERKL
ncbi:5,6-dimethylbenzimidazole synthase [Oryzomicrobium sp.]|uniref:5,6-dimethylbenzimidazole synthase n=1 Tax=Oryzomicrobium sp. TaxID=1911578 RepID=UPI0025EC6715|nr:5,6-dimethylbenzimidazole synthase [Oryzomicrobium sp.]MCE1244762.1 5,6-dimethylbenzimidazole synthase [Oryzomicrobium sp.]